MRIGTPREIKNHEYRVGLTPAGARELCAHGHEVFIEAGAGLGIGIDDDAYMRVGATILPTAARSEEHTSELQSLMRISYAVFCLKKKNNYTANKTRIRTERQPTQ